MTLWSVLAISQNSKDLRGWNQCEALLYTCVEPPIATNPAQLLRKIGCRNFSLGDDKNRQKLTHFNKKIRLKNNFRQVFGHVWTRIFYDPQLSINSEHVLDILRAKKLNWFFTRFHPFFTTRSTSESCNDPPKVLTEGSMVEYLPVGSQEAPQTIIGKKKIPAPNS